LRVRDIEINVRTEKQAVFVALGSALQKLEESRIREGRQLRMDMESQLRRLKNTASELGQHASQFAPSPAKSSAAGNADGAATKVGNEGFDSGSAAFKGDINEEVVRLKTHIAALGTILRESEPIGKKIDFTLQEIQRELNTISAKLPLLAVVQLVLQGKERVEKIREQTQNIE
jgi:uncharacterized protein (TIGR00255 family)